jgi:hypothetical protein
MTPVNYHQWLEQLLQGQKNNSVYMIEMRKDNNKWFLFGVSPKDVIERIYWTPNVKSAHIFTTEQSVEEFKSDYISPRKVSIIRIPTLVDALLTFGI